MWFYRLLPLYVENYLTKITIFKGPFMGTPEQMEPMNLATQIASNLAFSGSKMKTESAIELAMDVALDLDNL